MSEGRSESEVGPLIESEDYYLDQGFMVFTARYHLRRGYCCEQGCRHCPYEVPASGQNAKVDLNEQSK